VQAVSNKLSSTIMHTVVATRERGGHHELCACGVYREYEKPYEDRVSMAKEQVEAAWARIYT
jgi:hypothetical protein